MTPPAEDQIITAGEPESHPWASSAGIFTDDPFWDEMMASVARHRLEMDAEYQTEE